MSAEGPTRLGEYTLLERLGHGGMAMVYRAERVGEAGFKKTVAIKRMIPQYRRDPSLLERFAAEARTNARLDHPNLVAVVDFGVKPEPYLVMEFVEGVPLATLLQRLVEQGQKLDIAAACFIGAEAAAGLDHAHRKRDAQGNPLGIVHRDVSPQNVLLSNEGAVKVSDFGLVKAADNVVQTGSGIPIGKLSYMAPEQAQHHEVDARADVFSLGVVIWEMLAMRVLIPHDDPVRAAQLLAECRFHPPSRYHPEVSPELDAIVMSCLTKDPTVRTPSAQAVGMSLREVLHEIAPGYGRDQLARLLGWAFPERGWQLDEPHETAAQPAPGERRSLPSAQIALAAMERASVPPDEPGVKTQVDVQKAQPLIHAPAVAPGPVVSAAPLPNAVGPAVPSAVGAAPSAAASKASSALPWLLAVIGFVAFLIVAIAVLLAVLYVSVDDDDSAATPPPPGSAVQDSAGAAVTTTRIETSVPAQVYSGPQHLGATPLDVTVTGLESELVVVLAPGHRPAVLRPLMLVGQQHFFVSLVPDPDPARAVYVRASSPGVAESRPRGESLGPVPGVVLVPPSRLGYGTEFGTHFDVRFDTGRVTPVTAACDPVRVCVVDAGGG